MRAGRRAWAGCALCLLWACGDGGSAPESGPPPQAPVVHGVVFGHDGSARVVLAAATFAPADSVHFEIYASDSDSLAWMGLQLSAGGTVLRDSVAVPADLALGQELVVEYDLPVPATFSGTIALTGFARDAGGLLAEAALDNTPVSIWADVSAAVQSVALPAAVVDVAPDPGRNRAYLALAGRAEVATLELGSMTFVAPIATPVPPSALDLSPSGAALVAALPVVETVPVAHALGIADLTAQAPLLEQVPLPREPAEFARGPTAVRVTSRGEALVVLSIDGSGRAGYVWAYNLVAHSYRGGEAFGLPDRIDNDTRLARSADGARLLLYYGGSCCPTTGQLYDASSDRVLPVEPGVEWYGAPLSLARSGDRTLIKASLYGPALAPLQTYNPPGEGQGSALSDDGAYAYFRVGGGFLRTRLADGVTAERFILPETPDRLVTVPGVQERVLAFTGTSAYLVAIEGAGQAALRRTPSGGSRLIPVGGPARSAAGPL